MSEPSQPTPPTPPVPRYGEYAPEGYVPPKPAPGFEALGGYGSVPPAVPGVRQRRTWDLVLTIVLLVMAFFGLLFGVVYGVLFLNPELLNRALQIMGYGSLDGPAPVPAIVLIVSHVVLFVAAVGGAIALLRAGRIAFWVPLTAGVIAAIIYQITVSVVLFSDPSMFPTAFPSVA